MAYVPRMAGIRRARSRIVYFAVRPKTEAVFGAAGRRCVPALAWLGSLLVARGVIRVAGSAEAIAEWIPFACPLRVLTGFACPSCGLGRSLMEAWSGNWSLSLAYHPLGMVVLLGTGTAALFHALRPGGSSNLLGQLGRGIGARPRLMAAAIAAYALWGCARQLAS